MNRLVEHFFTLSRTVFSADDIEIEIPGTFHSRHALIKRALADGDLIRIRRGLYCLAPKFRKKPLNTHSAAQDIYGPSYVSFESALQYHGWIPEAVYTCTCACMNVSREYDTPLGLFSYERVPQEILYEGVERIQDEYGNTFFMASPLKALADLVYAKKPGWDGPGEAAESMRIESDHIDMIGQAELNRLIRNYRSKRVKKFLTNWEKELVT